MSYLAIDSDLLDVMITWDQTGTYEVAELQTQLEGAGSDDWMTTLLQTKAFHRIPPANIQAIFMRMQRVPYKAGEVVIKQGDEGDFFYAIVSGKCIVTRETPLNKEGIKLAELGVGDTFGEEALIAEAKRNATVTMLTDGVLMRLNKQDFRELMNEPLLQWVSYEQAREIVDEGRQVARRAPAERAPEPVHRGFAQHPAVLHPPEDLGARQEHSVRRLLRYGPAQLGGGLHPGGAWLRCVRADGWAHQRQRRATRRPDRPSIAGRSRRLAANRRRPYIVCVALSPESAPAR